MSTTPSAKKSSSMDGGQEEDEDTPKTLQPKKKVKKKKTPVGINVTLTKYEVVRAVAQKFGVHSTKEDDQNCFVFWSDTAPPSEQISQLKSYQRINHFPGMGEICRKDSLARNMAKMVRAHPDEYNFVPRTWIFPSEYNTFQNYFQDLKKRKKHRTFIVKPANGSMGNGISLYRNGDRIPPTELTIVQEYLDKPFLLEGYKFDLRVYVLILSCDPLRIFLFNDGLVRMSTEKYCNPNDSNVDQLYMHLTNYSINKRSGNFERSEDVNTGSKRSIKFLNEYLRKNDYDVALMWKKIADVIIKTMIVAEPHVLHSYRMCRPGQASGGDSCCFEILGFDVMLDRKLKPWLIEINRAPSFGTDEKIDFDIKNGVLTDTFRLLNMKQSDKRRGLAAQKAEAQKRLFRPAKRPGVEISEEEKQKAAIEKRKQELKEKLVQVRRDNAREDYENRNIGSFRRIYPPQDKLSQDNYYTLLTDAFQLFLSGRAAALQRDATKMYNTGLREEEILDMLQQCEASPGLQGMAARGPKPLSSMPSSADQAPEDEAEEYDESMSCDMSLPDSTQDSLSSTNSTLSNHQPPRPSRSLTRATQASPTLKQRPQSAKGLRSRPQSAVKTSSGTRARSLTRPMSSVNRKLSGMSLSQAMDEALATAAAKEREEETTKRTLNALNDMRIKFPGKTDEEAEWILSQIQENWRFHKPRIASYWLVKLDSIKRRKVIEIVRSNVRALLQRTWHSNDVDNLRLFRIFTRVFNRLLWSHGQGLWNCFSSTGNSWEMIFSKSSDVISSTEMSCSRRIVQLCRDCLLIVYQFAAEAKGQGPPAVAMGDGPVQRPIQPRPSSLRMSTWNKVGSPTVMTPISQRMSRLYPSMSMDNL
ncbi:tubulin polyglutamylase TTLL7-like isoform X2 [Patiria miniata]|uniref:Tubulin polyglutamylase TTLL7-like n=1 Tax=Patiria miniata TaxID=46514 RepID=A0A913ZCP3_PATMI|nr:tubulin polyglutamylase TTLL7-like isoform X2 [Patiria miniata]